MLFPKFSVRLIFGLTTIVALFFLVVNFAIAGKQWAIGLAVGIFAIPVLFVGFALMFMFAFLLTRWTRIARPEAKSVSPFVNESIPPQVIPPDDSLIAS